MCSLTWLLRKLRSESALSRVKPMSLFDLSSTPMWSVPPSALAKPATVLSQPDTSSRLRRALHSNSEFSSAGVATMSSRSIANSLVLRLLQLLQRVLQTHFKQNFNMTSR